jgi:ketosteroid isomerase-like protein
MPENERAQMTIARMDSFFAAWNSHDVERVVSFFTADGAFLASAGTDDDGTAYRGIAEVRRGVTKFFETFPDCHYTDAWVTILGERGFAGWTFHGTRRGGEAVSYRGVDIFEFDGDRIRLKDAFKKERIAPERG